MSKKQKSPKAFGTGLISLDLVMGADPQSPVRSWAGGTCGNVLSILSYLGWDAYPIARMNGDAASQRVKADMRSCGVKLDFAACKPTAHTPIIIQQIRKRRDGTPTHRFSWACPTCGEWLPGYKAVTTDAVDSIEPNLDGASVFFFDRLSRAALQLAKKAADKGAVVVFEPSAKSDPKMFAEALQLAHIVKYADQRLDSPEGLMANTNAVLVEVQTLGEKGLRYRHRLAKGISNWLALTAIRAPRVADTCGSGDWCTAGLVSRTCLGGVVGLKQGGATQLKLALRYGQALAAWNCGYEGARGGMYVTERKAFDKLIGGLLDGELEGPLPAVKKSKSRAIACPACEPDARA